MSIDVVITGANGRMGTVLRNIVKLHPDLKLAGLVLRKAEAGGSNTWGDVPVSTDLGDMLAKVPGAVVVDFTSPEASLEFARVLASSWEKSGAKQVIGSTGLNEAQRAELAELAKKAPILWSPNMSIGINVLLKVLPELVKALGPDYDMEVVELHHRLKKDSPSGTAVRLGECLAEARDWKYSDVACYHREGIIGERPKEQIGMQTVRGGDVVGVHTVYFMGPGERIEVNHQAHSRENFGNGAMRAAKWLAGQKPGRLYTMLDLLNSPSLPENKDLMVQSHHN
ncbi:MAG: 4-hydroxy-tetrahydrodipicolinate reductase [Deltaproteobacteria bacterium]|jgi:4-hydroxy-tetrahydrodipicolinate reductase|nr:4-hydroxy-tetrahydrodipicolinate reductase [Deltaproteobacteria bacterium]